MTVASHSQLTAEISTQVPSGTPSVLTAAAMRVMLHDMVDSYFVFGSTLSGITMTPYQPFTNTASASSNAVALQIFDGSVGVQFGVLNSTAHTIALTSGASIAATGGISGGSGISAVGVIASQNATAAASTASQTMAMGTAGPSLYFATGQPTVSSATQGSLCLSTGGSGPSTRAWVAGSTGNWIGLVAEA